jgi:hypothetical protein
VLELLIDQPIFIGFKVDNSLRQRLEELSDTNKGYASTDRTALLRICRVGEETYVGKIVSDGLTTDRVEDIRRNVLSIIRKIGHETRLPANLKILACSDLRPDPILAAARSDPDRQERFP